MRQIDFRLAYAQLGNHPGSIGPVAGDLVFTRGMSFDPGSVFIELGCEAGRATVLLGIAARNIGAKVYAIEDWSKFDPMVKIRFDWAIKTHGLGEVVSGPDNGNAPPPGQFDLLVVSREWPGIDQMLDGLRPGGQCIFLFPMNQKIEMPGFLELERNASAIAYEKSDDLSRPQN